MASVRHYRGCVIIPTRSGRFDVYGPGHDGERTLYADKFHTMSLAMDWIDREDPAHA